MVNSVKSFFSNKVLLAKLGRTLWLLALYRFLIFVPVPTADIIQLVSQTSLGSAASWLWYAAMLFGWSLDQFSIIALWLAPYINASIIMQLLGWVIPQLEELQEQWESGQKVIAQYTRWLSLPLSFVQAIWMTYFINFLLWGSILQTWNFWWVVIPTAFVLTFWSALLIRISDLITEHWLSNGTSLIIFASIISWIVSSSSSVVDSSSNKAWSIIFILVLVSILALLAILLVKTLKEIPVIYARQWKIQQTSTLPFPLNPVWMVPIIFAIAFASFPYLLSQLVIKFGTPNPWIRSASSWIDQNFNIYSTAPGREVIVLYFVCIIFFTFFYTMIVFNPEKIADNIQKRWWYIPSTRPGSETVNYINKILMHLCLRGWVWLGLLGIYSYVINAIPFLQTLIQELGTVPAIVTWSWVVIIIWVVQELSTKLKSEIAMKKYDDPVSLI